MILPFLGPDDVEQWVAVWNKVEAGDLTVEERLSWLNLPSYVPDLDLVVVAPNGILASYCICNLFREERGDLGADAAWMLCVRIIGWVEETRPNVS